MAALGCDTRRFEPSGPASDDDNLLSIGSASEIGPLCLPTDDWVLHAGDAAAGIDPIDTALVVTHALTNVVQSRRLRLVGHVRICDQRAVHDAQLRLSFRQYAIGLDWVDDSPGRDDGHLDDFSNARGEMCVQPEPKGHIGNGSGFSDECFCGAADDIEIVDRSSCIEFSADLQHLRIVESAFGEVVSRDADTDDELRPDAFSDGIDDPHAESESIVEVAAVFVPAFVGIACPELVDQVAVARHDLAAIEAPRLKTSRCRRKGFDEFVEHGLVERVRILAVIGLPHVARRVHAIPQIDTSPAAAPVCDLADHGDVVSMHRFTEFLKMGNHAIVEQLDAIPIPRGRSRMYARRSKAHHEADAASSLFLVITALEILRHAIHRERVGVRTTADSILCSHVPDLDRVEEVFKIRHGCSLVGKCSVLVRRTIGVEVDSNPPGPSFDTLCRIRALGSSARSSGEFPRVFGHSIGRVTTGSGASRRARQGIDSARRIGGDEAVSTQVVEKVARAVFTATADEIRGVSAGIIEPEQCVHSVGRPCVDSRGVISKPHAGYRGLPIDWGVPIDYASGADCRASCIHTVARDVGPSRCSLRDQKNHRGADAEHISRATAEVSCDQESLADFIHVDHVVGQRRAVLFGQQCRHQIAEVATATPTDQSDIEFADLRFLEFGNGCRTGSPRVATGLPVSAINVDVGI